MEANESKLFVLATIVSSLVDCQKTNWSTHIIRTRVWFGNVDFRASLCILRYSRVALVAKGRKGTSMMSEPVP